MATGRGQLFKSFRLGLEKVHQAGVSSARGESLYKERRMPTETPKARRPKRKSSKSKPLQPGPCGSLSSSKHPAKCSENHIERMPPEILLKILSYLDAASLFCIGYINKQFHGLANNNAMWYMLYSREHQKKKWKPKRTDEVTDGLTAATIQERPKGYWRRLFFKEMAGYNENKWKRELQAINPYTGLPSKTEQVLRSLHVTWELTVTDGKGRESTFEQSHAYFSDSSVTLCWSNGNWPWFHQFSKLQLHGVMRVALNCPTANKPGWRSLIAKFEFDRGDWNILGSDRLVKLVDYHPGLTVGLWRGQMAVAFVMVNLHFHKLVERSLLGSSICPYTLTEDRPPFDDVDPEYGLHGYTVHILLHNTVRTFMSGHFSQLFCKRALLRDGFVELRAIKLSNMSQHTPLSGKINLPWKTDALQGIVESCFMMSLTVLDEAQSPFWCLSAPVSMALSKQMFCYDYDGEHFFAQYQDSEGKVRMNLVWMEAQGQFFLVNLVIFLPVAKVNKHFGRDY